MASDLVVASELPHRGDDACEDGSRDPWLWGTQKAVIQAASSKIEQYSGLSTVE
jgi:hypothetical protein